MPTRRLDALTLLVFLAISAAFAQKPASKPQEVFAAYWTSEPGWDTELQLKNNLASAPLTVTPVLRLASGEEIPLDPVTIASNASVSVWVNEGLLKHSAGLLNQPGSYGSVVFRFTSLNAMNLYATAVTSLQSVVALVRRRWIPACSTLVRIAPRASMQSPWLRAPPRTRL